MRIVISVVIGMVMVAAAGAVAVQVGITIEAWKILVDFLKVLVWPFSMIWIAWYYRDDIRKLAGRVIEAGPAKVILAPPQSATSQFETSIGSPSRTTGVDLRESIAKFRSLISDEELTKYVSEIRGAIPPDVSTDNEAKIDFLVHSSATIWVQLLHERVYRLIFGSQLLLLLALNNPVGLTSAQVRAQYDAAVIQWPEFYATYTFEHWIGFLIGQIQVSTDNHGNYHITPEGRGLLRYIIDWKLIPQKPF